MDDEAELERRLTAGEWLSPGEVAILFHTSRWSVNRWLRNGARIRGHRYALGYRVSPGGHRECDPANVRALLTAYRQRRTHEDGQPDA